MGEKFIIMKAEEVTDKLYWASMNQRNGDVWYRSFLFGNRAACYTIGSSAIDSDSALKSLGSNPTETAYPLTILPLFVSVFPFY